MLTRRRFLAASAAAAPALAGPALLHAQRASAPAPEGKLPAPLLALTDRSHEAVPISAAEREARVAKARELLARNKMAALAITGGTSLQYFLGIGSGQSERLFACTLPARATRLSSAPPSRKAACMNRCRHRQTEPRPGVFILE